MNSSIIEVMTFKIAQKADIKKNYNVNIDMYSNFFDIILTYSHS